MKTFIKKFDGFSQFMSCATLIGFGAFVVEKGIEGMLDAWNNI